MTPDDPSPGITEILNSTSRDGANRARELAPLVYDDLRRIAERKLDREGPGHTLQATALVHEAYVKLLDQEEVDWRGRQHFLAVAAQLMPRILVDHARRRKAAKRGGGDAVRLALDELVVSSDTGEAAIDALDLGEALEELKKLNERQARVLELRFFGGLSVEETATELDVSSQTIKREVRFARAWLRTRLRMDDP
ncbi:MAG: sigma-70 family RNA polymerase sigma factor [Planctomycetota bacterium]